MLCCSAQPHRMNLFSQYWFCLSLCLLLDKHIHIDTERKWWSFREFEEKENPEEHHSLICALAFVSGLRPTRMTWELLHDVNTQHKSLFDKKLFNVWLVADKIQPWNNIVSSTNNKSIDIITLHSSFVFFSCASYAEQRVSDRERERERERGWQRSNISCHTHKFASFEWHQNNYEKGKARARERERDHVV